MLLRLSVAPLLGAACLLACTPHTTQAVEPAPALVQPRVTNTAMTAAKTGNDGNQRLGRNVVPLEYDVFLALDPTQDHFTGRTRVKVHVDNPTTHLDLHASELAISKVALHDPANRQVNVQLLPGPNAGLTV